MKDSPVVEKATEKPWCTFLRGRMGNSQGWRNCRDHVRFLAAIFVSCSFSLFLVVFLAFFLLIFINVFGFLMPYFSYFTAVEL